MTGLVFWQESDGWVRFGEVKGHRLAMGWKMSPGKMRPDSIFWLNTYDYPVTDVKRHGRIEQVSAWDLKEVENHG